MLKLDPAEDSALIHLQKEVESFEANFMKSDLRVVAGKGQQTCGEVTSDFVRTGIC